MRKILVLSFMLFFAILPKAFSKTVSIGLESTYYPPRYYMEEGKPAGINVELLTKAFQSMGYDIQWKVKPVNELYQDLLKGELDFKFPDNPEWKYEAKQNKNILYSDTVQSDVDGLFVLPKKMGISLEKIKKVGTLKGFTVVSLEHNIRNGNIHVAEYDDTSMLIQAAIKGKIDGAYLSKGVGNYYLSKILRSPGKLVFDESLPTSSNPYYLSTLKQDKLLLKLNEWLSQSKGKNLK